MTPFKSAIFHELEVVLAQAEPEQIQRLLSDIANGEFSETAQTRAGTNDNRTNVTNITVNMDQYGTKVSCRKAREHGAELSEASRDVRRQRYSS